MTMGDIVLTYAEAAVIALAAATVVLGGVALLLAIAAVFGYRDIKKKAVKASQKKAVESSLTAVRERLDEIADKEVRKAINEILESPEKAEALMKRVFQQRAAAQEELEPEFDPADAEER